MSKLAYALLREKKRASEERLRGATGKWGLTLGLAGLALRGLIRYEYFSECRSLAELEAIMGHFEMLRPGRRVVRVTTVV